MTGPKEITAFFQTPDTPERMRLEDDLGEAREQLAEIRAQTDRAEDEDEHAGRASALAVVSYGKQLAGVKAENERLKLEVETHKRRAEAREQERDAKHKLQAPDSMSLRAEFVARLKPEHPKKLSKRNFEETQKIIGTLRRARRTLERLGFEFEDLPPRGRP